MLYSVSPSLGSDVNTHSFIETLCPRTLCFCVPVFAFSLGTLDLELRFASKHAKSLPGDGDTEYSVSTFLKNTEM